jgi:MOSC domain-containing protein YiiM
MGKIEAIWIKRAKKGPMDPVDRAQLIAGRGLVGNANQGGRRQVSFLDADLWERLMLEMEAAINPSQRRANILVRGLDLAKSRKRILCVGDCQIRIFCETKPCRQMDEVWPGLKSALYPDWGGGASGEVIAGGIINVGDEISWKEDLIL